MWTSSRRPPQGRTLTTADPHLVLTGGVAVAMAVMVMVVVVVEAAAAASRARDGGSCGKERGWRKACGCRKAVCKK